MADGWFAGGLAEGLGAGVDIAGKLRALQEAAQARSNARSLGKFYGSAPGGIPHVPPVPMTGQTPMPGQQSMPMGNTSPDPMMTGAPPMPAATMMPSAAPPMPMPPPPAPPMPPEPMSPPTGAEGTNLSGTAAPSGQGGVAIITDANDTIRSIAAQIKAADPDIDPETLIGATRLHIENMKGVRSEVRDYMVMQTEYAKIEQRSEDLKKRLAAAAELAAGGNTAKATVATINAGARTDAARITGNSRERVGAGHDDAGIRRAEIGAGAGVTRAQIAADSNRYRDDKKYEGLVYDSTIDAYVKMAGAAEAADARVAASEAGMGKKPVRRPGTRRPAATAPRKPDAKVTLPPRAISLLREGVNTDFENGQTWTLKGGAPTRVK